jgi:hypothetical protein
MNRKEFLRSIGRASILGGMGVLVVLFAKQGKITMYSDCTDNLYCKGCKSIDRCALPEAKKEKAYGKG